MNRTFSLKILKISSEELAPMEVNVISHNFSYSFGINDSLLKLYGLLSKGTFLKHKADYFAIFIIFKTNVKHSSLYPGVIQRENTFHEVRS